jgi:cobalt/nickel transport system permease protein
VGAGHAHALYVHEHSVVHHLPPHVKVVAGFTFVATVASTPREVPAVFAVHALLLLVAVRLARIPLRFVLARLVVVAPFLLLALVVPFVAAGERIDVVGLSLSVDGLWGAFGIAVKALLGAATSILLVATTEVPGLLRGLERLRVPPTLTQIATFMVRYLEVIAGEFARQRVAMTSRGHDPRWLWQLRPLAASAGALFVRSYERGERVHAAMLARGYVGVLPPPASERAARPADWALAATLPALAIAARLVERSLA